MRYVFLAGLVFFGGCSAGFENVRSWQKATLAKETMKPNAGNSLFGKFENHIYFSKEGAKGGGSVAGGGCGCN